MGRFFFFLQSNVKEYTPTKRRLSNGINKTGIVNNGYRGGED